MNISKIIPAALLVFFISLEWSFAQTYEEYVQTWSGQQRARFVTYHYEADPNTENFSRSGFVSDRPFEWSSNLGIPGPNQLVDPFLYSSDDKPGAKNVVIMVHGYGAPIGAHFLDRDEDFFTGADISVHESGATAWFDKSQSGEKDQNGLLVNNDAKLYPYLRLRPAEYGFDPDEWVILAVTINILQNIGGGLSILENADRLRALVDVLWHNYEPYIKTISFVSHSTGSPIVKSVLGERGQAYRNAHPWIAHVDDHINLAGAVGGTPAVLFDPVAMLRPIGRQLLYGIQHPDDYVNVLNRYTGGAGLASGTYKRTYRWPDHVNVMSVAGVWGGGPILGAPLLPVPPFQPLDGNPHTGNGVLLIPNEVIPAPTANIYAFMGKSDGVVPNMSVIEQIKYRSPIPGSQWHDQVNPSDQYGIDMSPTWVLPTGGDRVGGGRIVGPQSNAFNIPVIDRYPGSKVTYVEVEAEHNGMLHNEHLMIAIKRRLGAKSVSSNVSRPVVTGLSRHDGPLSGGNTIRIYGNHFKHVNSIYFGATETDNFHVISPSQIDVTVPPGVVPGVVDVRVDNTAGVSGQTASEAAAHRYTYMGMVAVPVITPDGGDFAEPAPITLVSQTEGAEIYYTWTESEPGPDNPTAIHYVQPFLPPVNPFSEESGFTLRVRAFKANHYPSETAVAVFNAGVSAHAPHIGVQHGSPPDGTATITMSAASHPEASSPAFIYYTTNGADPTYHSTLYQGPFTLGIGNHTIKARTIQLGFNQSAVVTEQVTIFDPSTAVSAPVIKPFSTQTFTGPITISMENFTEGAIIRYTLAINGGLPHDPPETGPGAITYTGPFQVNIPDGHLFLKARAFKDGFAPSSIVQTGQISQIVPITTAVTPQMRAQILEERLRTGLPDGWEAFNGGGNDIDPNIPNGYLLLDHPDDWIVTPAMNLLDYDEVQLTVDLSRQTGSGSNRHLLVEVSNDDGLTWTHDSFITDQAGLNWQTRGPHPFSTDGENIRLRFRRVDQNGQPVADGRGVGLRDVKLTVALAGSPERTAFFNPVQVFMESFTPNPDNPGQNIATNILYTSDGTDPEVIFPIEPPNTHYTASGISVDASMRLKAIAHNRNGLADSEIGSAELVFKADRPAIHPPSGSYVGTVTVEMTTQTGGGIVRYTLDGTEPHENSTAYTEPLTLSGGLNQVIARTFRQGYEPGQIRSAIYSVGEPEQPVIMTEVSEHNLVGGDTLRLRVFVSGAPEPDLRWYQDGEPLVGANADSLLIYGVGLDDAGLYSVSAVSSAGSDSATVALVSVEPAEIPPVIEVPPASTTVSAGGFVRLEVVAIGRPSPDLQWYVNGLAVTGATSRQLTISGATEADSGEYFVVATNTIGVDTSATALLEVIPAVPPQVVLQPQSLIVSEGDTIKIETGATGDPRPLFEWYRNGELIVGAIEANLIIPDAKIEDSGTYYVFAINFAGADSSEVFTVQVQPKDVSAADDGSDIPKEFALHPNYPNPFNTGTIIPFDMPVEGNVEILIYNILGQRVVRIQRGMMPPGRHLQSVEFSAMASGVYIYELRISDTASPYRKTRKMMLIK